LVELANLNVQKSHYAYERLSNNEVFEPVFKEPFFNEFVLRAKNNIELSDLTGYLQKKGVNVGIDISQYYSELERCMLLCVTEAKTKESIDQLTSEVNGYV